MTVLIPRLLILDDELPLREFLTDALAEICTDLIAVADVREAFRALESDPVDIVLADTVSPVAVAWTCFISLNNSNGIVRLS